MFFRVLVLAGILLFSVSPYGVSEEKAAEPERPAVTKIGENQYRLGQIELDSKTQAIRIPVTVNMREGGPIEYILVHENGKVHESIFTTTVSPLHLQVAMKLLKYKAGHGDVFDRLLTPEALEKEGGEKSDRGSEVVFSFQAKEGGDEKNVSMTVIDGAAAEPMNAEPWIYTGSRVEDGVFMAEAEGSLIAIYLDHLALFNMVIEGADTDDRWGANSKVIPEIGTKGTLIIRPARNQVTE